MKIIHLINELAIGGAQMMLYTLLSNANCKDNEYIVISIIDIDTLENKIKSLGIPVYKIKMKPSLPSLRALWSLIGMLRKVRPDIIHGWMYHSNLAASLASIFVPGRIKILWSVHHTIYRLNEEKKLLSFIIRFSSFLSSRVKKIIYCSQVSADQHEKIGFAADNSVTIPNGFDCNIFKPSAIAYKEFRSSLDLQKDTVLIAHIARYHPMKDHLNFIEAARIVHQQYPEAHFICVGKNIAHSNNNLSHYIRNTSFKIFFHLLGEHHDIQSIMPAFDIVTSSSAWGESFPIVLGEAMACEVPCVATNVGDSSLLIGDTGKIVEPGNPEILGNAIVELIKCGKETRRQLGRAARERIIDLYSIDNIIHQYEEVYQEVMEQ